ncbi:putative gustatory receptor 59b [Lucilia cuprina]|uniref:putative gustatory receptor 59b n=1 Tax=Lucilia cuprina TaxID=7375 RepID=UPI001F063EBB|nr:putative gustatory receptor 59b [Lucilia cuprina]
MDLIKEFYKKCCEYYPVIIGATAYLYKGNSNTYRQNILTRIIAGLSNIVCLFVLFYFGHESLAILEAVPHLHPLIKTVTHLCMIVRIVAVFYTILHRKWREEKDVKLKVQLRKLKRKYYEKFYCSREIDKRFKQILYIKYSILLYVHFISFGIASRLALLTLKWWRWILVICNATIMNMTVVVMFDFFVMLWNICHLLQHLNYHLGTIYQKLEKPQADDKLLNHEIQTISETHAELGGILKELLKLFQFQILTNRLYSTFSFIIVAYFGYVFIFYYEIDKMYLIVGGISYLIFSIDFYTTDLMCDMINESFKQLIMMLQMFNERKTAMDGECERFVILLTSKKEIFCSGMDRSAWFGVMSQLVSSALVLIQTI